MRAGPTCSHLLTNRPTVGLNPSEKHVLAELYGSNDQPDTYDVPTQEAKHPSPSLLGQRLHGDEAFIEELCEKLRPLSVC